MTKRTLAEQAESIARQQTPSRTSVGRIWLILAVVLGIVAAVLAQR